MGKRISKYDRTLKNDIKYRGPLSYRHLLCLGWLCIALKVFVPLSSLGIKLDPNTPAAMQVLNNVLGKFGTFALFFFLIANFAIILDKKKTYKQQLIKFGVLSLLVIIVFIVVQKFVVVKGLTVLTEDSAVAAQAANEIFNELTMEGSMIFNLFIDMFLCTLFMFFLEYTPVKYFQGKNLSLFRAFAILPVLYELGALMIRISMVLGNFRPPMFIFPFLTTKPFMSFILFVILALHIKWEDYRFKKKGRTRAQFEEYLKTNAHSLRFSIFTSIMILVTGAIDLLLAVFGSILVGWARFGVDLTSDAPVSDEVMEYTVKIVEAWKIGNHFWMVALIPIILLFSYTRNHKNKKLDILIPIGGILLVIFFGYMGIRMNLPIIERYITEIATALEQSLGTMTAS